MYSLVSQISQFISEPITLFLNTYEHSPLIIAILLGLIGALAPCQLTGNISAITLYGNRTIQMKSSWGEIGFFILGKVVVFSGIGFFAWLFGQSFETEMTLYFPLFRKAIGPLMIITGLILIGFLKLKFIDRISSRMPLILKEGKFGSFLLGASFSIAFCPTMFVLFFVWLMPTVVSTSYGLLLPGIFGIATAIPLILLILLIRALDTQKLIMKNSRKIGNIVQLIAGTILIIIGVFDTITYWEI
ncbi:cytochrome C biosynthesis protein [Lysinibacillus contaminans]|uniref:Cytochrome C biosynthesis protein n=1 Tax=Lysinibacillus contaminans TaxID=1293441 RepID=A0ABR5JZD4_9BACI|nr:sulfite exporter TauE/SafE family protein [Lysinibacillus contaminans]KOS68008.1 cytochrome C biosynthesis protein [Lysinibacillus contaminans]